MDIGLHKILYLYITPSKFYLQPVEDSHKSEAITIDRQSCEITLNSIFSASFLPANTTSCLIYGIIGIKHLVSSPYLIVVTKASQIGQIDGHVIYRMDKAQLIPFKNEINPQPGGGFDWNSIYLSMIENVLSTPSFYFSYSYDLTNTLQRSYNRSNTNESKSECASCQDLDLRFMWNWHLMTDFVNSRDRVDKYILPIIHGFVSINGLSFDQKFKLILISRRSVFRAGTRFNSRGIDHEGHVSNFVESEQIVEANGIVTASFVQIRGSIPLIWSQRANYKYKPAIEIGSSREHDSPIKKHFNELKSYYGGVTVINLIDHKGHEGNLEHEFSQQIQRLQEYDNIPYYYFDFHRECSKMRWHRLSILLDRIEQELDSYGYFAIQYNTRHSQSYKVAERQCGVMRSNCIDSLDRTNVVQSLIGLRILEAQLVRFGLMPPYAKLRDSPESYETFKNVWADNADALSVQYAGTPALKTDFTRTGKRTQMGLVRDGVNSLTRYITNNFHDQYRQDAIDLFLGVFEGYPPPRYRPTDLTNYTAALPVTIVVLTLIVLYFYFRL